MSEIHIEFGNIKISNGYLCVGCKILNGDQTGDENLNFHFRKITVINASITQIISFLRKLKSEFEKFKIIYEDADILTGDGQSVSRLTPFFNRVRTAVQNLTP